ncbi:MAG: ProQ/FinO family protein [Zoogloeaceae bacterium]|jgi:ProP effector|nr:ProQ/FinO family protein [Zoogloeaceae bacterium]
MTSEMTSESPAAIARKEIPVLAETDAVSSADTAAVAEAASAAEKTDAADAVPAKTSAEEHDPGAAPPPSPAPYELLALLQARFEVFRAHLPLTLGIDKAIRARCPEIQRKTLRVALSIHTHSNRYLRVTGKSSHRFNLDGQAAEALSEEHRQYARDLLSERLEKHAAKRRENLHAENSRSAARETPAADSLASAKTSANPETADAQNQAKTNRPVRKHAAARKNNPRVHHENRGKRENNPGAPKEAEIARKLAPKVDSAGATAEGQPLSLAEKVARLAEKFARQ